MLIGLLRSAATNEQAATLLREFLSREVLARLAALVGHEDGQLRATFASSQLIGLAMERYILRIEPLASAPAEVVAAALAPALQRYLTGDLHLPSTGQPGSRRKHSKPGAG